jgi:MFS family permease
MSGIATFYLFSFASFLGHGMLGYSVVIYTQSAFESELLSGGAFFAMNAPLILIGFYAGTIADRVPRRQLLILSNGICLAAVVAVWLLVSLGRIPHFEWLLIGTLSGYGLSFAFIPPARFAMLGDLRRGAELERATVYLTMLNMIGFGSAPMVVGWTLGASSWAVMFGVLACVWAIASLSLFSVSRPASRTGGATAPQASASADLRAGLRFIVAEPVVWQLCLVTLLVVTLTFGPYQVLVPAFGAEVLGLSEAQRGTLMAAFGVGLILGGSAAIPLTSFSNRGWLILGAALGTGISIGLLPVATGAWLGAGLLTSAGFCGGLAAALIPASMQAVTPDSMRGRVMSINAMILGGFPAVGALLAGALSHGIGLRASIHTAGALGICVALVSAVALPQLRNIRSDAAPAEDPVRFLDEIPLNIET